MQILGPKASLRRHEQDVLYAGAACKAHDHPDVQAVGDAMLTQHQRMRALRAEYEGAEDGVIIAEALRSARDERRDKTLVSLGRFADALGGGDRAKLFKLPPSKLAELGYQAESAAIHEVLTKLGQYPDGSPLRAAYLQQLSDEQAAFDAAAQAHDEAAQRMTAARFTVLNAKLENDAFRERQLGRLISLLGREGADSIFRSWRAKPKGNDQATQPADEPPSA